MVDIDNLRHWTQNDSAIQRHVKRPSRTRNRLQQAPARMVATDSALCRIKEGSAADLTDEDE